MKWYPIGEVVCSTKHYSISVCEEEHDHIINILSRPLSNLLDFLIMHLFLQVGIVKR